MHLSKSVRLSAQGGVDLEAGADVEGRYKKLYEENIDPFKEFSRKVRRLSKLPG